MRPPIHLTGVEYFVIAQCCIHSQPSCSLRDLSSLKFEISIQRKFFPYKKGNEIDQFAHETFQEETEELVKPTEMFVNKKRQVLYLAFTEPLVLDGDIKLTIQCTGAITDQTLFIWFNTGFISRSSTLFIESEIDYSGKPNRTRRASTSQTNLLDTQPDPPSRVMSLNNDSDRKSVSYGATNPVKCSRAISQPSTLHLDSDTEYILLDFNDAHLSSEADPDSAVIRKENLTIKDDDFESGAGLRAIGETRKKMKGIVSGGTHILRSTTEIVGKSIISLMNGENPLIDPRDHNGGSSSTINLISGSSSSNMKTSQIHTNSSDVEKENDFSEPEMFFEVLKNADESDSS